MNQICGVILSGGESRRYGKPKAFEKLNGISFWEYSLQAVKAFTDKQVIVSHPNLFLKFQDVIDKETELILDEEWISGKGPMAGIYSAMNHYKAEWYIVLSCDIPNITNRTISRLLSLRELGDQAIIPVINDKVQPLVAIYHHTIFELLKEQLRNDQLKMMHLLEKINVRFITKDVLSEEINSFQNINRQSDFEKLLKKKK